MPGSLDVARLDETENFRKTGFGRLEFVLHLLRAHRVGGFGGDRRRRRVGEPTDNPVPLVIDERERDK